MTDVPDVVEALLEVLRTGAPAGVVVWDGPVRDGDTRDAWFIGFDPDEGAGGESVKTERTRTDYAGRGFAKTVTVPLGAYCRRDKIKDARRRVYELLTLAEDAVLASLKASLPVGSDVEVSPTSQLFPWPSRGGVEVRVRSWVVVKVLTSG